MKFLDENVTEEWRKKKNDEYLEKLENEKLEEDIF